MLKVLWLCSWYPNKIAPFEGAFIQRHAQAASLYSQVTVIKLTPDPDATGVSRITRTYQQWPNLTEILIYYPKSMKLVGKTVSFFRWYSLYKFAAENYIEKNGPPDLVHVHIPFRSGMIARQLKRKYKIPFVVTEHWGGYNNIVEDNYGQRQPWFRSVVKDTLKDASALHSVSFYLGEQIRKMVLNKPFTVIPNCVNTEFFTYNPVQDSGRKFRLLHISDGSPVKNVPGIIKAFNALDTDDFELTIVGMPEDLNRRYKKMYPGIHFTGIISYHEVADQLRNADCFALFSNSANLPCAIAESLCCGVPVIATRVGGVPEMLDESNGLFVSPGDVDGLAAAILEMQESVKRMNQKEISENATSRYSFRQVAFETDAWYKSVLSAEGKDDIVI